MWIIIAMLWLPWAALAVWVGRQLGLHRSLNQGPSPEEAVKRAYARGEIDRDRFLEMMADLGGGGSPGTLR